MEGEDPTESLKLHASIFPDGRMLENRIKPGSNPESSIWRLERKLARNVFLYASPQRDLRVVKQIDWRHEDTNYPRELQLMKRVAKDVEYVEIEHLICQCLRRPVKLIDIVYRPQRRELFVEFIGWFPTQDSIYFVLEYCSYGDISQQNIPMLEVEVRRICKQLMNGLEILHRMGIIHRDIKPKNVLVVGIEPIRVKIADFGISKITRRDEANTAEQSSKISGTHGYIAPERLPQVSGTEPVNSPAVDVWSLGCLAYALLTGKLPFMDKTEYDYTSLKSYYQGSKEFPKGPLVKRRVSQSGQHFVQRLLAPSPQNRPDASEKIMTSWEDSEASNEEMTSTIELDDTPVPQPAARTSQELFVLSSVQRNLASRPTMDLPSSELWYLMKSEKSALVDRDRLEILLLSHANPNIHFKGYTALHVASEQGSLSSLRELLRFAADPTIHTEYNQESVIHLATAQGDATIFSKKLQILLEWGAEINAKNRDGDTALHYLICRIGDPELIVSFLAKGASIEIKGRCGRTPLQYAIFLEQEEIASILLDHDANPFCEDESGVTPLHLAMQSKKLSTAIVERLIGDGSCINQEDKSHRTPLFEAAAYGRHDFIRLLVANGARCSPNSAELESRINQAQSQWRFKVRLPWSA